MECYPPSEDTFLLEDAIKIEKGKLAIEVGSSTGYLSLSIRDNFEWIVANDIEISCLKILKNKIREKKIWNIEVIACDLLSPFRDYLIDMIFFNPPYLPKDNLKTDLDRATIYNFSNRNIIREFLNQLQRFKTKAYMVISSLTNLEIKNLKYEIVKRKRLFFEELLVLKFSTL